MKKILLLLLPALMAGMWTCEKTADRSPATGQLEFVMEGTGTLKSAPADTITPGSFKLLLSVTDPAGAPVFEDRLVNLYRFGDGFTSEKIEIGSGNFLLTKFMVLDASGTVIYASPVEGSSRAYLVNHPLPLSFGIRAGEVTTLKPEVLGVNGAQPSDFGYAEFGMQIVNPLPVFVLAMLNNPMVMAPTQITDATLLVSAGNEWSHTFQLERKVNRIEVKKGFRQYTLEVMKDGYEPAKYMFSEEDLHLSSPENPIVLNIPWPPLDTLTLQPGPEKGKDAMISDLDPDTNFGNWPYFEASYLSESPLTVMRTNSSLIWFDLNAVPKSATIKRVLLTLHFEKPLWDSVVYPAPTDVWYGAVFQKFTGPWEEGTVTWNTRPPTTEANQVYITPQPQMSTNARIYDVTSLYVTQTDAAFPDLGFMFRLYPSPQFPGFRFASSDYPVAEMRPRLTVYYSLPDSR